MLEYCFQHEPRPGYFKGTCLFDPLRDDTPARMRALADRWPKRLVALRIHAVSRTVETSGPIRNRDLADPRMLTCWQAVAKLGMAVQMHFIPVQAPRIRALAAKLPDLTVILDHMGRPSQGTDAEYNEVVKLAELPRVILKFSNWSEYKGDLSALTRRLYDAFGPRRMIWATVGNTPEEFRQRSTRFEELLSFASSADRDAIRRGNSERLFLLLTAHPFPSRNSPVPGSFCGLGSTRAVARYFSIRAITCRILPRHVVLLRDVRLQVVQLQRPVRRFGRTAFQSPIRTA